MNEHQMDNLIGFLKSLIALMEVMKDDNVQINKMMDVIYTQNVEILKRLEKVPTVDTVLVRGEPHFADEFIDRTLPKGLIE
jgi:hypothetical protein